MCSNLYDTNEESVIYRFKNDLHATVGKIFECDTTAVEG